MPAISDTNDKNDLLDKLSVCLNRAFRARLNCEAQGRTDDVVQFDLRIRRLQSQINLLIQGLLKDWAGDASALKVRLDAANAGLNKAVADLERSVEIIQSIVKAVGYIDDALAAAASLLP